MQKKVDSEIYDLSDEGIEITSLSFENIGEATQTATLKIRMSLESNYYLEGGGLMENYLIGWLSHLFFWKENKTNRHV